jgi:hypothetical protein
MTAEEEAAKKKAEADKKAAEEAEAAKKKADEDKKAAEAKKQAEEDKKAAEAARQAADEARHKEQAGGESMEWGTIMKKAMPISAGVGGILGANATAIAKWPILKAIPYLPQAASWFTTKAAAFASYLGINTGAAATSPWLAGITTSAGPFLGGAIGMPLLLSAAGYVKSKVVGKNYGGFWNCMKEGAKLPIELVNLPFGVVNKIREKGGGWIKDAFKSTIGRAFHGAVAYAKPFVSATIKPTWPGVATAVAGGFLASMTAPALLPGIGVGYVVGNVANWAANKPFSKGGNGASVAMGHA